MRREFETTMQGRILAVELLVRGLLTEKLVSQPDPPEAGERLKSKCLASLQHIEQPAEEYSDQVWEAAANALRLQFDQVIRRLASTK